MSHRMNRAVGSSRQAAPCFPSASAPTQLSRAVIYDLNLPSECLRCQGCRPPNESAALRALAHTTVPCRLSGKRMPPAVRTTVHSHSGRMPRVITVSSQHHCVPVAQDRLDVSGGLQAVCAAPIQRRQRSVLLVLTVRQCSAPCGSGPSARRCASPTRRASADLAPARGR